MEGEARRRRPAQALAEALKARDAPARIERIETRIVQRRFWEDAVEDLADEYLLGD